MTADLGILGVGEIASAIVDGLCDGRDDPLEVVLSPRGRTAGAELARRHPTVRVARDNQAVLDVVRLVVLAVGPGSVDEALTGLRFVPGTVLVSAVAGLRLEELRALVGPEVDVVRAIPLPAVRHRAGTTALLPAHQQATALFERLGSTVAVPDERAFAAISAVTATISSHLDHLAAVVRWACDHGVPAPVAEGYVRAMFSSVGATTINGLRPLSELVTAHETPGGLNAQFRATWADAVPERALRKALDGVLDRGL